MKKAFEEKFLNLINKAEAYSAEKKYVDFSAIWQNPNHLKVCAEVMCSFLLEINGNDRYFSRENLDSLVLVSPDSLGGNLGIIPATILISQYMGCKLSVWKELADIQWGTSAITGCKLRNLNCILIQDVVDEGTTAMKMVPHLKDLNWKLVLYYSAVFNPSYSKGNKDQTMHKLADMLGYNTEFVSIVDL